MELHFAHNSGVCKRGCGYARLSMSEIEIPWSEIQQHNNRSSCWVVIHKNVYNLTNFIDEVLGSSYIVTHGEDQLHYNMNIMLFL